MDAMTRTWWGTPAAARGWLVAGILALGCAAPAEESGDAAPGESGSASEMVDYLMTLDLGTVHFPTSGSPDAQRYFDQGVAALHSFTYYDAALLFRHAQALDPDFAMAYWGEAMTYNATLWVRYPGGQQHRDEALAALARLGPTPEARAAKAPTERERAYLSAVDILYGDGPKQDRDLAYSEAMQALSEQYSDDDEALAFYCLSRLSTRRGDEERTATAAIALELLVRNPEHPGAARYLIHATDRPTRASLGLVAAERYAAAAPDTHAAHHMPAHIFIQFGRWADASRTGERAVALAREWVTRRGLETSEVDDHTYGHLMDYLQYALLQEGRYADARALAEQVRTDYEASGKAASLRVKVASTSARYLIETGRWDEAAALADTARAEGFWETPAVLLAVGLGAARTGDLDLAAEAAAGLETAGPAANLMAQEVSALLHLARGEENGAVRLLDEAAAINRAAPLPFGPAAPMKPALELYGEVLLMLDRPGEAVEQFEAVLARRPGRTASLLGAARAREHLGDQTTAAAYYAELADIWSAADPDHAGYREAQQYATR